MQGLEIIDLNIFLNKELIHAYFNFLEIWGCASSTKRNDIIAFRNVLKFFQTFKASEKYIPIINNILNELSILCKVIYYWLYFNLQFRVIKIRLKKKEMEKV